MHQRWNTIWRTIEGIKLRISFANKNFYPVLLISKSINMNIKLKLYKPIMKVLMRIIETKRDPNFLERNGNELITKQVQPGDG